MDSREEIINNIKNNINREIKEINTLPTKDSAGYNTISNSWATVVSIDIVKFKEFSKAYKNKYVIKAVQSFMNQLTKAAKDEMFKDVFRDVYFAGDEVIVVFDANDKGKISKAINYAFYANTIANDVIPAALKEQKYNSFDFKCGIGIWTSQYNSLVMIGHKHSKDTTTTLIGDAINNASFLAKQANRTKNYRNHKAIMMNSTTYINAYENIKISVDKFFGKTVSIFGEQIYEADVIKTALTR